MSQFLETFDKFIVDKKLNQTQLKRLSDEFIIHAYKNISVYLDKPDDIVMYNKGSLTFPYRYEDSIKYHLNRDNYAFCPKFLKSDIVEINGEYYHRQSDLIAKAKDTGNHKLREDLIRVEGVGYYESDKDLLVNQIGRYVHKDRAKFCEDVEYYEDQNNVIHDRKTNKYYRYQDFIPYNMERINHAPYFKEIIDRENPEGRLFGIEFEYSHATQLSKAIVSHKELRKYFFATRDGSLDGLEKPAEYVSIPLTMEEVIEVVPKFLEVAENSGAQLRDSCGYHVHIGGTDINFIDITSLIAFCSKNEESIFDLVDKKRTRSRYCRKLDARFEGFIDVQSREDKQRAGDKLYEGCRANFTTRHKHSKWVDQEEQRGPRYYWVNIDRFYHMRSEPNKKTIEFRNHEATWDAKKFVNYCILCYYIVEFCKQHSKKTAKRSSLEDIVKFAKPIHKKQLIEYLN